MSLSSIEKETKIDSTVTAKSVGLFKLKVMFISTESGSTDGYVTEKRLNVLDAFIKAAVRVLLRFT